MYIASLCLYAAAHNKMIRSRWVNVEVQCLRERRSIRRVPDLDVGRGGSLTKLGVPSLLVVVLVRLHRKGLFWYRVCFVEVDDDGLSEEPFGRRIVVAARTVRVVGCGCISSIRDRS